MPSCAQHTTPSQYAPRRTGSWSVQASLYELSTYMEIAMTKAKDGQELARENDSNALRALHRFGWLRTRDLGSLLWQDWARTPPKAGPSLRPPTATPSGIRMAQRTVARLRRDRLILTTQAPNGSLIHALSERGARALQNMGIAASSGKDMVREFGAAYFLHRSIANEIAISGILEGYRVATERETAQGRWLGGMGGICGKKPDVLLRASDRAWWVEVERRKNQSDYARLLTWLDKIWETSARLGEPAQLLNNVRLVQVVFICSGATARKLATDLASRGWSAEMLTTRIRFETSLYSFRTILHF